MPGPAVIDLFSGFGGLTAGFLSQGFDLEAAVDADSVALGILGGNAAATRAQLRCVTLRAKDDWTAKAQQPPPRKSLHLHATSPCQSHSHAKRYRDAHAREEGLAMFRHAIETPLRRGDRSFTLEQVAHQSAIDLAQAFANAFPERVAYTVLDASDLGSPSSRRRLIVGDPQTIKALKEEPTVKVSVRAALERYRLEPPATAKWVGVNRGAHADVGKHRSLEDCAPTVVASHPLNWFDADGASVRCLRPAESAALMGFSKRWKLPRKQRDAQRAVGNAIPVALSKAMARSVRASMGEEAQPAEPISQAALDAVAAPAAAAAAPETAAAPGSAAAEARAVVEELNAISRQVGTLVERATKLARKLDRNQQGDAPGAGC